MSEKLEISILDEDKIKRLKDDALIMALRLMGEDDDTFGPECYEVMQRWRPIAMKALKDAARGI